MSYRLPLRLCPMDYIARDASLTRKASDDFKEKLDITDLSEVNLRDKDEALKLVGLERTAVFSEEYYAKLRRKLDLTIPPLCAAVYCTQYLDKTALSYASIMGFPVVGQQYNLVALSFYVGFLFWVFPTMYIAQRLRLGKYLGANIVAWGIVMMLHAVPRSFGSFFAMRLLLGMLESCVSPVLVLIISMFYKKDEQARRISWFYLMTGVAGIFGGFIAYGVSFDTNASIAAFKIIYLLLGGLALVTGVAVLLWMPDSPLHAGFLTKEERIAAIERIRDDQGGTENKVLKKDQLIEALLDIRTWLIVLTTLLTSIPNGGLANFSNIIGFGYTTKQTLILSIPGGIIGILSSLICGWYSDKKNERMSPIAYSIIPTIVGAAMLVGLNGSEQKGALLFATYIVNTYGSYLAIIYAYNASNTSGHTKKVTVNAITLAAFCVGNIVGTETFLPKDSPGYLPGKISILVLLSVQFFLCFMIRWTNLYLNRKKQKIIAELRQINGWSDADIARERERHAFVDMTDKQNPYFVYTA
ncbi:Allantoate permease [Grifola frondosa]|uniref:Allantoate permease n=1 Tax=Grifola frondosa TaxID=5627 RepID=A0A1C7M9W4_GRIFR|nr:Allantoate permease [Grifola frondosa]